MKKLYVPNTNEKTIFFNFFFCALRTGKKGFVGPFTTTDPTEAKDRQDDDTNSDDDVGVSLTRRCK